MDSPAPPLADPAVFLAVLLTAHPTVCRLTSTVHSPSWLFSVTAFSVDTTHAVFVVVVVVVGRGGRCVFLARHPLDMCPEAPHDQQ